MNRRKKSALFSVSVASLGLVAGALMVLPNKAQAEEAMLASMSYSETTEYLSGKYEISEQNVTAALETKTLIAEVKDSSILDNDPTIAKKTNIFGNYYVIEYRSATEVANGYANLKKSGAENITLNETMTSTGTETSYAEAWGRQTMYLDKYVEDLSENTTPVTIAVLDSGILAEHEIFTNTTAQDRLSMALAKDFVNDDNVPNDDSGHGTMVASVIAQSTPKNVKIIPVKVLSSDGKGTVADVLCGMAHVKDRVHVINLSIGFETKEVSKQVLNTIEAAMTEVKNAGAIVVAAAGNEKASEVIYPAAFSSVIGVSSVGKTNEFSSDFSNHGKGIDFAAPGEGLVMASTTGTDKYTLAYGTSFSAPFVSAAVANILVENPGYNFEQVYDYLKLNAEDLGTAGWDEYYGWGSLSFHINRYADLKINSIDGIPSEWTNKDIEVTVNAASSKYNIKEADLSEGTKLTTPSLWTALAKADKTLAEKRTISKNGTYTLWLKNSANETASKSFTVSKIDKTAPALQTNLKASDITAESFKLSIALIENTSGITKIEWYYKAAKDADYTLLSEKLNAEVNAEGEFAMVKTHAFDGLTEGDYVAYAKIYDQAGNVTKTDELNFTVSAQGGEYGGDTLIDQPKPDAIKTDTPTNKVPNPKTDSQGVLPAALAGGAFILLGTTVIMRKRR